MRARLNLVVGAVTAMVVIAFLVPLTLVIRDLAADRAGTAAQNQAEAIAQFIALQAPVASTDEVIANVPATEEDFPTSYVVATAEGQRVIGEPLPTGETIDAALGGAAFRARVNGGEAVYTPVLLPATGETVVVRVFVSDEELSEGVARSTAILMLLGLALVAIAVGVADWLGRSMVQPVKDLSATAATLGRGNLEARVDPSGPPEIQEVGIELNELADRIVRLLRMEREAAADLSHRLRTPLTAVKLDAEALQPGPGADRLREDLDELERTVDFVINEARRPIRADSDRSCDLGAVAATRVEFWTALAEEQGRQLEYMADGQTAMVTVGADDATAMIDALIGNVFAHTEDGVDFTVAVAVIDDANVMLIVDDDGPGFSEDLAERGLSAGGSTGLGLDIAARTASSGGGALIIGTSGSGGGRVTVTMPVLS
ncbi:MAG: HAMP domain-containing sensor histidine kinase [Acidimicrobiia bacterium]|nr:HAMP domain-containing sensor histidine kinase [Acidimicrobiia bacterium]